MGDGVNAGLPASPLMATDIGRPGDCFATDGNRYALGVGIGDHAPTSSSSDAPETTQATGALSEAAEKSLPRKQGGASKKVSEKNLEEGGACRSRRRSTSIPPAKYRFDLRIA